MGGKQVDIKIPLLGPENQSSPPFLGRATGPTCCIAGRWGAVSSDDDGDDDDLIFKGKRLKKYRFFYSVELISGNHGGQIICDDDGDDDDDDDDGDAMTMGMVMVVMIMMVMAMMMMIMMIREVVDIWQRRWPNYSQSWEPTAGTSEVRPTPGLPMQCPAKSHTIW